MKSPLQLPDAQAGASSSCASHTLRSSSAHWALGKAAPSCPPKDATRGSAPARSQSLDVLRGFAIFLVLFNHLEAVTVPMLPKLTGAAGFLYWRLKNIGWTGVDLFFVLSGFLISGLLFRELDEIGRLDLRRFWMRRAFKILPSYWLLLAVLALTGATPWLDASSLRTILRSLADHLLFFQNYISHNPNGPTWSLAVEEHFYLILPLMLAGLCARQSTTGGWSKNRLLKALAIILVGVPILRILSTGDAFDPEAFRRTHFRLDGLAYGVLAQFLCRYRPSSLDGLREHPHWAYALSLVFVGCGFFSGQSQPIMFMAGYTSLSIGYTLLLLTLHLNGLGTWSHSWVVRSLAAVGRWSYNTFLWNYFLWCLPLPGYREAQTWMAHHLPWDSLRVFGHFLIFAAASVILGGALTEWVEKPFLRLRDGWPTGLRPHLTPKAKTFVPSSVGFPARKSPEKPQVL